MTDWPEGYDTEETPPERFAEAYAQHLAVETFGTAIDVTTVRIVRQGEPHDQYDETGGVPL